MDDMLQKVRDKLSNDMDNRLPLHSVEWDYAKELLVFIDMVRDWQA